jgi:hypothetical protein
MGKGIRGEGVVEEDIHPPSMDFSDCFAKVIDCAEMRIDEC